MVICIQTIAHAPSLAQSPCHIHNLDSRHQQTHKYTIHWRRPSLVLFLRRAEARQNAKCHTKMER